jgi:hypothetical protein
VGIEQEQQILVLHEAPQIVALGEPAPRDEHAKRARRAPRPVIVAHLGAFQVEPGDVLHLRVAHRAAAEVGPAPEQRMLVPQPY